MDELEVIWDGSTKYADRGLLDRIRGIKDGDVDSAIHPTRSAPQATEYRQAVMSRSSSRMGQALRLIRESGNRGMNVQELCEAFSYPITIANIRDAMYSLKFRGLIVRRKMGRKIQDRFYAVDE